MPTDQGTHPLIESLSKRLKRVNEVTKSKTFTRVLTLIWHEIRANVAYVQIKLSGLNQFISNVSFEQKDELQNENSKTDMK